MNTTGVILMSAGLGTLFGGVIGHWIGFTSEWKRKELERLRGECAKSCGEVATLKKQLARHEGHR